MTKFKLLNKIDKLNKELQKLNYVTKKEKDGVKVLSHSFTSIKPKFSFYFKFQRKIKKDIHKIIGVTMELRSGKFIDLYVDSSIPYFIYEDGCYIIDNILFYYNDTKKMFCLDYHQNFSLPIKRSMSPEKIKNIPNEFINSTNPMTLKQFIISKIAEGIMKGAEIETLLKRIAVFGLLSLIFIIIHILIYAYQSGLFKGVL